MVLQSLDTMGKFIPVLRIVCKCKEQLPYYKELLHCLGSIRYCMAEVFKNCIIGTLRLPQKSEQRSPQLSFSFYLTGQSLLFVEDVGDLKLLVEKRISMFQELNSPAQLLLQFMEQMIEDDVLYLSHIESETEKMEENIGSGGSTDFFPLLTKRRQKLSELNAYYEQLTDIGELFQSRACSPFANEHLQMDLGMGNEIRAWMNEPFCWDTLIAKIPRLAKGMKTSLEKLGSWLLIFLPGLMFSFYLLAAKESLLRMGSFLIDRCFGVFQGKKIRYVLTVLNQSFHHFLAGQTIEAVILGMLCTIGMWILRLPYAAMIGCLVGVTALLPVIGAYIGAAAGACMLLTVSPVKALVFLIFLTILQQIEGNFIYPRVVGHSIGLPCQKMMEGLIENRQYVTYFFPLENTETPVDQGTAHP